MENENNVKESGKVSQKDQIKEILEKLEKGVTELFESERYREYLSCMSKFHNYSLNNTLLIAMQKPNATFVTGFHAWHDKHGRTVKKGEKGIKIFAPVKYKIMVESDVPGEEPKEVEKTGFKVAYVWAISQTEGKELPNIGVNELKGNVNEYGKLMRALRLNCRVPISFEDIEGSAKGYYNDSSKEIVLRSGMSQTQTIKTLIHEMAHQRLHSKDAVGKDCHADQRTMEVEAESIAFTVCKRYGLDTDEYSFGYIAGWSSGKDAKELKTSLERIRNTADEIITAVDKSIEKQNLLEDAGKSRDKAR